MIQKRFLSISLCVLPAVITFVELFLMLHFTACVRRLIVDSKKAFLVLKSTRISDRWKEKVLPRYSLQVMASTLLISVYLGILLLVFASVYFLFGLAVIGNLNDIMQSFNWIEIQIFALVFGIFYAFMRSRRAPSKSKDAKNYSITSKIFHHIALGNTVVKEMAFDIDCMMTRSHMGVKKTSPPVFVAGLARAGTTILLEALYSTGAFTTMTYRDMPLVTAPYLWSKITRSSIKKGMKKERAHGDRLYVNYDSPEAFEETFWMTFSNGTYIKDNSLEVHEIDLELVVKYRKFVGNIIAREDNESSARYLAKNNNNLLRIKGLKSAFADSVVIVPFRNPIDQAKSLHLQHERFLKKHSEDPFSMKYMCWLGHFEFGVKMKPFNIHQDVLPKHEEEPRSLNYWTRYWKCVYEYVIRHHLSDVVFFNYDKFCEQPSIGLRKLESALSLEKGLLKPFSDNVRAARQHAVPEEILAIDDKTSYVYKMLQTYSL